MFRRRPKNAEASGKSAVKDSYSFFGEHQSGISTDAQDRMYFAALTLKTTSKDEIKKLFKEWSEASRKLMAGEIVGRTPLMKHLQKIQAKLWIFLLGI